MDLEELSGKVTWKGPPLHGTPAEFGEAVRQVDSQAYRVTYRAKLEVMIGLFPGIVRITQADEKDAVILAYVSDVESLEFIERCSLYRTALDEEGNDEPAEIAPDVDMIFVQIESIYQKQSSSGYFLVWAQSRSPSVMNSMVPATSVRRTRALLRASRPSTEGSG